MDHGTVLGLARRNSAQLGPLRRSSLCVLGGRTRRGDASGFRASSASSGSGSGRAASGGSPGWPRPAPRSTGAIARTERCVGLDGCCPVAHEQAALRDRDDLAERGHPVALGHGRNCRRRRGDGRHPSPGRARTLRPLGDDDPTFEDTPGGDRSTWTSGTAGADGLPAQLPEASGSPTRARRAIPCRTTRTAGALPRHPNEGRP